MIFKRIFYICIVSVFVFLASCVLLKGENYNTVLLERVNEYNSDINFRVLSKYYGLRCKILNLENTQLVDSVFKNSNGSYIRSICISYKNLEDTSLLDTEEINLLKNVISDGSNLIINDISDSISPNNIEALTDSAFNNVTYFSNNDTWKFEPDGNNISDVLVNTTVSADTFFKNAYTINCNNCVNLISDANNNNPIFLYNEVNEGKVFLNGTIINQNLNNRQMWNMYYGYSYIYGYIQNILPIMMFLKYSNGEMCWHSIHKYANLTIDDPYFIETYGHLNLHDLFDEMQTHNFHTTIAFIPKNFNNKFDTSIVNLFKNYPDRYSIVEHGNNHDGYEFICYTQDQLDTLNETYNNIWINQTPRPYKDQECDIVEGRTRLDYMYNGIGINYGKIMVFPYGISLSPTLEMLKKYNFNMTVNAQYKPYLLLPGDCDTTYDFYMTPANMGFGNFGVCGRRHPYFSSDPSKPNFLRFKLNMFIGKPILSYTHEGLFVNGQDAYDNFADSINYWYPDVEWHSLNFIIKRLYLEKLNFDSTIDVEFFGNDIVVSNETNKDNLYHLKKYETGNVPIYSIKIDSQTVNYTITNDTLEINVNIPAHCEKEIKIRYYSGEKDFLVNGNYVKLERINDTLYFDFLVSNMGADSGACPVCVYYKKGNIDSLMYLSAVYLNSYCSKMIKLHISDSLDLNNNMIEIKLDQYNLIDETNESNNNYLFSLGIIKQEHKIYGYNVKLLKFDRTNVIFRIDSPANSICKLEMFDITGRSLFQHDYSINEGRNRLKWGYSGCHKGIYFATFKMGTFHKTIKFIKY